MNVSRNQSKAARKRRVNHSCRLFSPFRFHRTPIVIIIIIIAVKTTRFYWHFRKGGSDESAGWIGKKNAFHFVIARKVLTPRSNKAYKGFFSFCLSRKEETRVSLSLSFLLLLPHHLNVLRSRNLFHGRRKKRKRERERERTGTSQ